MDEKNYIDKIQFKPVASNRERVLERTLQRIRMDQTLVPPLGVARGWKYLAVAASLALLVVSGLWLHQAWQPQTVAYLEVQATAGAKTRVILPDSSVVWLNSNATLRYPRQFVASLREVEVTGEALFDVKKQKKQPFVVHVGGMSIKVLGTRFNVLDNAVEGYVETTLLRGAVALYSSPRCDGEAVRVLQPDQQAIFHKASGQFDVNRVRAQGYAAWVDGKFHFEGNTVQEIMQTLERAFDVKIHIQNEALNENRLTAHFVNQETLDEILSILEISAHYTYTKKKGEIYIR